MNHFCTWRGTPSQYRETQNMFAGTELGLSVHYIMGTCFTVICICRVLVYKEESRTLVFNLKCSISQELRRLYCFQTGVRDFPHGRHWVLGSQVITMYFFILAHFFQLELPNMITLSLLAWGSATERELRLWNVLVRMATMTIMMPKVTLT